MLIKDDKVYRNLQEQVQKNKDDISTLISAGNIAELGIKIVNAEAPLANVSELPNAATYPGAYGDAYIVGIQAPFRLYVFSRSTAPDIKGFWFDWGELNAPSVVPGPIGPQGIQGERGVRGSFWYSQSGAPTNTEGVNENDQALDGASGDVYQYVGGAWQLTGNIRGPQGIQGVQGATGATGPQGLRGPQGPQGPQGQFVEILGTLTDTAQLPDVESAPRSAAYLIPDESGAQHIWLIIGEGTPENPYLWHDAGGFGGGTSIVYNGATMNEVNASAWIPAINSISVLNIPARKDRLIYNAYIQGTAVNGDPKNFPALTTLPIGDSDEISWGMMPTLPSPFYKPQLTDSFKTSFSNEIITKAATQYMQIVAPTTSKKGQLSEEQLDVLQGSKSACILFNNEIYSLQDNEHTSGYLTYSHVGYDNTMSTYQMKFITVTISTRGWALTSLTYQKLYKHIISFTPPSGNVSTINLEAYTYNAVKPSSLTTVGQFATTIKNFIITGFGLSNFARQRIFLMYPDQNASTPTLEILYCNYNDTTIRIERVPYSTTLHDTVTDVLLG